jgi:hypothetical protein
MPTSRRSSRAELLSCRRSGAAAPSMPLVDVERANMLALAGSPREARGVYDNLCGLLPFPAEHPAWMAVLTQMVSASWPRSSATGRRPSRCSARPCRATGRSGPGRIWPLTCWAWPGCSGTATGPRWLRPGRWRRTHWPLAVRLDMPGTAAEAGPLAARIAVDRDEADPLTSREREVAALLAEALSDRQIAARLVLWWPAESRPGSNSA